ncbi:MAG TPA: metal ABC transporter ATP-binding protein [Candidatus Binatia bacterium]|nr:metal ABC transporter ATP-binding protein [Candidatus Binatia bacterium]
MTPLVLKARDLALAYDGRRVLSDVDLAVHAGEFWFLIGPNGAGKSTLLRAIVGMLAPRAGTLRLDPMLAGREHVGFVPQRCDLNPALPTTVREFVLLGTVGLTSRTDEATRLDWALDRAGLGGMARRGYWALSGGERQRALVARALVRRPRLLILDEPTNNLDPGAEDALLALLGELNRDEGLTLLVVTHDLRVAARHATHVALVAHGGVRSGPRDQVLRPEHLRAAFGGTMELALQ